MTIYGIIMLCTFFMCLLFNPTSELPVVSYFGRIMVFTLLSLLSMVVYYSRDELTPKGWWVRKKRTVTALVIAGLVAFGVNSSILFFKRNSK